MKIGIKSEIPVKLGLAAKINGLPVIRPRIIRSFAGFHIKKIGISYCRIHICTSKQIFKSLAMETTYVQQEVLLVTGTTFTSENLCQKDNYWSGSRLTEEEQLEEACWNGFLQNMLPEVILQAANGDALYLWQVRNAGTFLELALGEVPTIPERQYSISPDSFLRTQSFN